MASSGRWEPPASLARLASSGRWEPPASLARLARLAQP